MIVNVFDNLRYACVDRINHRPQKAVKSNEIFRVGITAMSDQGTLLTFRVYSSDSSSSSLVRCALEIGALALLATDLPCWTVLGVTKPLAEFGLSSILMDQSKELQKSINL